MQAEQLEAFLISRESTVVEAMRKIDSNARGILFVTKEGRRLAGVVTDGDIRRWLLKTGDLKGEVGSAMNRCPKVARSHDPAAARQFMEKESVTALPVVDEDGRIEDVLFLEQKEKASPKRAGSLGGVPVVIMAGGKGTRLYPYTKILPKPLIPIGDIPIMERIIHKFSEYGIRQFYATVNYRKSMIKSYFSEAGGDYELHYVEEEKPLGTAGSLGLISPAFDRPFLITNCDVLIHADYADIYRYHQESGNEMTIVTALKNIEVPYGVIHSKENGAVKTIEEKPKLSYFVNTGMYALSPGALKEIPEGAFFHMTDLAGALLAQNRKIGMYPISEDSFLDMGEFEEMRRMEEKLNLKSE